MHSRSPLTSAEMGELREKGLKLLSSQRCYEGHYLLAVYYYYHFVHWSDPTKCWIPGMAQWARQELSLAKLHARRAILDAEKRHPDGIGGFCDDYRHALLIILLQDSRKWWWRPLGLLKRLLERTHLQYKQVHMAVNS